MCTEPHLEAFPRAGGGGGLPSQADALQGPHVGGLRGIPSTFSEGTRNLILIKQCPFVCHAEPVGTGGVGMAGTSGLV